MECFLRTGTNYPNMRKSSRELAKALSMERVALFWKDFMTSSQNLKVSVTEEHSPDRSKFR